MSEWETEAKCQESWVDPDWFFPIELEDVQYPGQMAYRLSQENYMRAKLICAECPVARQCLKENLDAEVGVFGGFDEREREAIAAGRAAPTRESPKLLSTSQQEAVRVFRYGLSVDQTATFVGSDASPAGGSFNTRLARVKDAVRSQQTLRLRSGSADRVA